MPKLHNSKSRSRQRRRGQALLMAVLIMVFAALLGATFVTVVALNLSQTARDEDKVRAEASLNSGLQFINQQIVGSIEGEYWRPEMMDVPPAPGQIGYAEYYSPFDRAMGWARTLGAAPNDYDGDGTNDSRDEWKWLEDNKDEFRVFVKFPSPLKRQASNGTTYMAEVKTETSGANAGMLKLTVIGLATDNPAVFARRAALKPTRENGGPFSFAQYDSNFNVNDNKPLETVVTTGASVTATPTALGVEEVDGIQPGRLVVSRQGANTANLLVTAVDAVNKTITVKLLNTTPTTINIAAGAPIRAATQLMEGLFSNSMPSSFDNLKFDADGNKIFTGAYEITAPDRKDFGNSGAFFNGALFARGNTGLQATSGGQGIRVAGPVEAESEQTVAEAAPNATPLPTVTPIPLSSSPLVRAAGWDSSENPGAANIVRPLSPGRLSGNAAKRYLELTRYAAPSDGSAYGYGPNIYIPNAGEVEKIGDGTKYRTFKIGDMHRWWQRKSFPAASDETPNFTATISSVAYSGHRLAWPTPGVTALSSYTYPLTTGTGLSLEQRGIRGWVSPHEFLPRGTLVELRGDEIVITRDDRTEAVPDAPDPASAWREPNGTTLNKVYRMVINVVTGQRSFGAPGHEVDYGAAEPFNGVICAEGNLRVRGWIGSVDLTIVSLQGNIYIDGSLRRTTTTKRVALLARRNVVLNPTQVIHRPYNVQDSQVVVGTPKLTANVTTGTTIAVDDLGAFRVGDVIRVDDTTASATGSTAWLTITTMSASDGPGNITVTGGTVTMPLDATVRLLQEAPLDKDTTTKDQFYSLIDGANPFGRELSLDTATPTGTYNLAMYHAGEQIEAFQLNRLLGVSEPVRSKTDTDSSGLLEIASPTEKHFQGGSIGSPEFNFDLLQITGSSTAGDANQHLGLLNAQFPISQTTLPFLPLWSMNLGSTVAANANQIPARYLATVDRTATLAVAPVKVPLTVSLGMYLNPTSGYNAFGVPTVQIGSSEAAADADNVLTTNESFYWHTTAASPLALVQTGLQWQSYPLGAGAPPTNSLLAIRRNSAPFLPTYRVAAFKPERDVFDISAVADGTSRAFTPIDINVDATIFAEEGSWFVIPVPSFTPRQDAVTLAQDADENGTVTDAERAAATRFRRTNYRIRVTGNISQNFTPTGAFDYDDEPDADNVVGGAVRRWLDTTAYPTAVANTGSNAFGTTWKHISYRSDPLTLGGASLYLPVSPDLIYTD